LTPFLYYTAADRERWYGVIAATLPLVEQIEQNEARRGKPRFNNS
jgi:hypothetical protein